MAQLRLDILTLSIMSWVVRDEPEKYDRLKKRVSDEPEVYNRLKKRFQTIFPGRQEEGVE